MREKIKVTPAGAWEDKDGNSISYYKVGDWTLELLGGELEEELLAAKHAEKVFKVWNRWLTKNKKKLEESLSG